MKNIYLIYGMEDYFINKEIDKIKNKFNTYEVISYDMTTTDISIAIEDALMPSLFSDNKIIICYNSLFLTTTKCDIEHNTDELLKYFKINNENILILTLIEDALDNRKKIVKELKNSNVIKCEKLNNYQLNRFIKDYCKTNKYNITEPAINLIKEKLTNNLYIITSELDKLFLYKDDFNITIEDVELVISRIINTNIFDLTNAIVDRNIDKALFVYDDLKKVNIEEIVLVFTLANQFRLIYQVKTMYKEGLNLQEISRELGEKIYRIDLANSVRISEEENIKILRSLVELDELIKTSNNNKEDIFLDFILSL